MGLDSTAPLEELKQKLTDSVEHVSIRGLTGAPFLFATNKGKAVEVSTNDQHWWMEAWEASDDEDAPPVGEFTYGCEEDVLRKIREWLDVAA